MALLKAELVEIYRYRTSGTLKHVQQAVKAAAKSIQIRQHTAEDNHNVSVFTFYLPKGISGNDAHYAEQIVTGLIGFLGDN